MATQLQVRRATLFDPKTGNRVAVDVGSPQSRDFFGKGYQLETPTQNFAAMQQTRPSITGGQQQPPLPTMPGETEALINKYVGGGYKPAEAASRVNELFSGRPQAPAGTEQPRSLIFNPTGETLSTEIAAPTADKTPLKQSFNDAIMELLRSAQRGTMDEDLLKQRNALVGSRFGAVSDVTPEDLRALSPDQQAALRSEETKGIESQLRGVSTSIEAREAARKEQLGFIKEAQKSVE